MIGRTCANKIFHKNNSLMEVISQPVDILFATGSVTVGGKGRQAAFKLSDILNRAPNRVAVVGHSDPNKLRKGARFASNWELSPARAVAVSSAMRDAGYSRPINTFGRGDGVFYDLSARLPPAVRLNMGRRVDLIIREEIADERNP